MSVIDLSTGKPMARLSMKQTFDKVGYIPHPEQRSIHSAGRRHRFRAVPAGRRFGKSNVGGHELTVAAMAAYHMQGNLEPKGNRHEYWIVGPEYTDAEKEFRVVYNDLDSMGFEFDRPGTYYSEDGGALRISLFGGRFLILTKSAKHPETLVGERLRGVILAEAAKLKEVVWTKYIRPTLADYANDPLLPSWGLLTSTPEGKNWFYKRYMDGQDETNPDWWSVRAPSWANTHVFPNGRQDAEILAMERDMSVEKFKQEVGADFTEFVGRVFKDYSDEVNVGNYPYDPRWPVYIAMDKGYRAPSVVLFVQVDVFDNVWVCGEYYRAQRTAEEIAEEMINDPKYSGMIRAAVAGYPDPASPEWNAHFESRWEVPMRGHTGGDLSDRLDLIRRWLRPAPYELPDGHPEKIPKLHFDSRSTPNSQREFNDYRYPESRDETGQNPAENPLKADDHTPEALGRFFKGHFGQTVEENGHARVSTASMSRARR